MRNSSLVEGFGADNSPGLKPLTEAMEFGSDAGLVGERSHSSEAELVRVRGAVGSENAGMSSVLPVKTRDVESLRFPTQRQSA